MGAMACQALLLAFHAAPSVAAPAFDHEPSGLALPPATTTSVPVQAPTAPDRGVSGVRGSWCQPRAAGLYAARSTDPVSPQQPARLTRTSDPVHTLGLPTGLGPMGMSDHVPTSAGTVVVAASIVVVDEGLVVEATVAVVEDVDLVLEPPHAAASNASTLSGNIAARRIITVTCSRPPVASTVCGCHPGR